METQSIQSHSDLVIENLQNLQDHGAWEQASLESFIAAGKKHWLTLVETLGTVLTTAHQAQLDSLIVDCR